MFFVVNQRTFELLNIFWRRNFYRRTVYESSVFVIDLSRRLKHLPIRPAFSLVCSILECTANGSRQRTFTRFTVHVCTIVPRSWSLQLAHRCWLIVDVSPRYRDRRWVAEYTKSRII